MRIFKLQSLSKLEWSSDWDDTQYRQNGNDRIAFCSEKGNGRIAPEFGLNWTTSIDDFQTSNSI